MQHHTTPFEYNGIKFFSGDGFKLDDRIEDEIEDIILRDIDVNGHITGDRLGDVSMQMTTPPTDMRISSSPPSIPKW